MASGRFDFYHQKNIGDIGEKHIINKYPTWIANNNKDVKNPDLVHISTKALSEVKYDESTRAMRDRNGNQLNFFIEVYSDNDRQTLGGPFRANEEGVDYLVYIFADPFKIYILNTRKLKKVACRIIRNLTKNDEKYIPNNGYQTMGYALPISEFNECIVSEKKFIKGKILNKKHKC